jgi:hypothetical protein
MSVLDFEQRLYPHESSMVGFLLPGQKLSEVIIDDIATAANVIYCLAINNFSFHRS